MLGASRTIKSKQSGKYLIVAQLVCAPRVSPTVGVGHGGIEHRVGVCQPLRAGVVEVGQSALLQFLRGCVALAKDAEGIRYAVTDSLKAVAGVFAVNKPYFNLDADDRYRQLGDYSQRGVELSLAGSPAKGLYVVAGTLLLDPRVTGEEVDAGTIGRRPVGQTRRLTIVSGDYQLPRLEGVSINATMTSVARRIASRDNRLALPARAVIDFGARYRFRIGDAPGTLGVRVSNAFNKNGWRTNSSEIFVPLTQRRASITLAADL